MTTQRIRVSGGNSGRAGSKLKFRKAGARGLGASVWQVILRRNAVRSRPMDAQIKAPIPRTLLSDVSRATRTATPVASTPAESFTAQSHGAHFLLADSQWRFVEPLRMSALSFLHSPLNGANSTLYEPNNSTYIRSISGSVRNGCRSTAKRITKGGVHS